MPQWSDFEKPQYLWSVNTESNHPWLRLLRKQQVYEFWTLLRSLRNFKKEIVAKG